MGGEFSLEFNRGKLDIKSIKVIEFDPGRDVTASPQVFLADFLSNEPVTKTSGKHFKIEIGDKDLAERIAKALAHIAGLCGAKNEPF